MGEITFFTEVDYNKHGNISAEYPAWYFTTKVDELRESISAMERELKRGNLDGERKEKQEKKTAMMKRRLSKIEEGLNRSITAHDRESIEKATKEMAETVRGMTFTYDERKKKIASPHEEARRMVDKAIPINSFKNAEMVGKVCEMANVRIDDGRVSRDDLTKAWKIASRALGDGRNTHTSMLMPRKGLTG